MPNWVQNRLVIDVLGQDEAEQREIRDFVKGEDEEGKPSPFSFQQIRPMPEELKGTQSPNSDATEEEQRRLKLLYGADNWYDWRTANWGSKWDCKSAQDHGAGSMQFEFETPWSTPVEIIKYLSRKFPIAVFQVEYADEDIGHNCGTYHVKDGKIIEEIVPEDADRFSCDVWDFDHEEYMADRQEMDDERVAEIEKDLDDYDKEFNKPKE